MDGRKHDPLKSLPRPSGYAVRVGYAVGDIVTYNHQVVYVSAVVDFHQPLAPGQIVYVLSSV